MKLITTLIAGILVISAASVIEASSSASFTTGESQQNQMTGSRFRGGLKKFSKRGLPIPVKSPLDTSALSLDDALTGDNPLTGGNAQPGGGNSAVNGKLVINMNNNNVICVIIAKKKLFIHKKWHSERENINNN